MANSSTLIGRRNYGMKIAMPGFDARTAGDNELLFNSSFPILQIKVLANLGSLSADVRDLPHGGEYCGEHNGFHLCRWYHGLGYPPFFIILNNNHKKGLQINSEYSVDEQFICLGRRDIRRSEEKILICPIDVTRDIEYPYTAKPIQVDDYIRNNIGSYGFKSVEHGDITKNDFDNYGVNIRLQSQMIMAIKTEKTLIDKPTTPGALWMIDYNIPRGMSVDDCMAYCMYKIKGIMHTEIESWYHTSQYAQYSPSIRVNRKENRLSAATDASILATSLIVTRLPMVAAHKTESVF